MIRDLVEREADLRGKAVFALGYWAGCRVSDVSWLLLDAVHVSSKAGWMTVGHKSEVFAANLGPPVSSKAGWMTVGHKGARNAPSTW